MSENTTDEESEVEAENAESSDSGLKTLVLIGVSFIAGYIVGKSRSESSLGELEELGESGTDPMEIEIHDADAGTTTEPAEEPDETANEDGDDEETTDTESDDEEEEE